jgi:hypothetical protein
MEENDVISMLEREKTVRDGAPCTIVVQGKVYSVKQISNTVRRKIADLEKEALILERESKGEITIKRAKRIDKKIRTLHSKTAAYYLLNNKALFIPFLFAITWRILDLRDSEHTFEINKAGMNNKGVDFFLANWQITKVALALSTKLVGEGIKSYQERMESAESMLEEDATRKKAEDKSEVSLKARQTTKR